MASNLDTLRAQTLNKVMGGVPSGRVTTTAMNAATPTNFKIGRAKNKPLKPVYDAQNPDPAALAKRALLNKMISGMGTPGVGQR